MFILPLLFLSAFASDTLESIKVDSLAKLEQCYAIQPYLIKKDESRAKTDQAVDQNEIMQACSEKATSFAQTIKSNPSELEKLASQVRAGSRAESSLPIYKIMVENDKSLKSCDSGSMTTALKAALGHPKSFPSANNSDVSQAYKVLDICMKNKQFFADMVEYADTNEVYLKQNLCAYLKIKNIKAKCQ